MSSVVKQLLYVELPSYFFRVTAGLAVLTLVGSVQSKETLQIMYPKYPVFDMSQRIHLRCGTFGSMILFWILLKKRNIHFLIKNYGYEF